MKSVLVVVVLSCFLLCCSSSPFIYWNSQPSLPGETVLLYGAGLKNSTLSVCIDGTSTCQKAVPPQQAWDISTKFPLLNSWELGVYRVDACDGSNCSTAFVNAAEVTWIQGHDLNVGIPGSTLYIFGRALAFDNYGCIPTTAPSATSGTAVTLTSVTNKSTYTLTAQSTCYDLQVALPLSIPPDVFTVSVSNRLQTRPTQVNRTGDPLLVQIINSPVWPTRVFDVRSQYEGNVSQAVAAAVQAGGGVVYVSSGSCISMSSGEQLNFENASITLVGDGTAQSSICWTKNTVSPSSPLIIGYSYRILNISLYVSSLMTGAFISTYSGGNNFVIDNVNINVNVGLDNYVGNVLFFNNASQILITNSFITQVGNCTADWSRYICIFLDGGHSYKLINNKVQSTCSDYAVFSIENVIFEHNSFTSIGQVIAEGNGFNTLGKTVSLSHVAFIRNCQIGSSSSKGENEAWTEDGPNGAYFGNGTSKGNQVFLATPATSTSWGGGVVFVLAGTGAGQFSRIAYMNSTVVTILKPFPIPLDSTSIISVTAYHGDVIVAGNYFNNGTTVQTYGSATNQVFADNSLSFMKNRPDNRYNVLWSGLNLIGKQYGGGQQPNFFVEVYNNFLINSQYLRAWAIMGGPFGGPWIRSVVFRGNMLRNTSLVLENYVSDIIVEKNTFTNPDTVPTISLIGNMTEYVLIQNNINGTTPQFMAACPGWSISPSNMKAKIN